jgi:NSS family neurotransmitter:Na+ symporter
MGALFGGLATDGWTSVFWAGIFMCVTIGIVAAGIGRGIESACRVLMPMLILMMLGMVVFASTLPGFAEGLSFVFKPDAASLKPSGVLEALGHAFFTLSLGMGALITYGSYQKRGTPLFGQVVWIAGLDTGIALLACMMMFPIVFSFGQDPGSGPGLVFISMPLAFAEMGSGGILLGAVFFFLLTIAALTSAISLLEVAASYFIDRWNWSRPRAAVSIGVVIFGIGTLVAFSMSEGFLLASWTPGFGMNLFDTFDFIASNWLLPLGGLLIAIYAGWFLPRKFRDAELASHSKASVGAWLLLIRFVAPAMVLLVLAQKIGLYDANELLYSIWN